MINSARERSLSRDRLVALTGRQRSSSRERHSDSERGRPFMRDTASSRERLALRERARSNSRERSFVSSGSRRRSPSPSLGDWPHVCLL